MNEQQSDMRKLKGHREPKEVIKLEPEEPVNRIKPKYSRDGDRKYLIPDRKSLSCYGCGDPFNKEHREVCKAANHTCSFCNKKGHLEACCWSKQKSGDRPYKPKDKMVNAVVNRGHPSSSDNDGVTPVKGYQTRYQNEDDYVINRIQNIQNAATNKDCIRLNIKLNEVKVKAVLDTGSPISIIPMYITDII